MMASLPLARGPEKDLQIAREVLRDDPCPNSPQGRTTRLRLERSCPEGRGSV